MRFYILFILLFILRLEFGESSFYESYDDMLIQCRMNINSSKRREKHICEKENFDDDFEYKIAEMKTPYSELNFICISFEKEQEQTIRFKLWFSHDKFAVNAFGVKYAKVEKGTLESSVKFKSSFIVIIPSPNTSIPQIFGFELNGQDVCPFCGQRLESAVGLIRGGDIVKTHHKYPWHMTIYHVDGSDQKYKCGASLIRDNKVITAAHCVTSKDQKLSEDKLRVKFIEDGLFDSKHRYKVFKSFVHELYSHETYEHDIAILVLETSIDILRSKDIRAICLPPKSARFSGDGHVVGFGTTENNLNGSSVLLETTLEILKPSICHDKDPSFFSQHLFKTNFCAGKTGHGVCSGDSGGGFYMQHKGLWILKGIVSNTKQDTDSRAKNPTCSNDNNYALFTDVSQYLDWIEKKISNL